MHPPEGQCGRRDVSWRRAYHRTAHARGHGLGHTSPLRVQTEYRQVCNKRPPFRHTEMDEGKALILLVYVCYKRLLQKESRSRAPTTDEVKDAHRVCTRVHGTTSSSTSS